MELIFILDQTTYKDNLLEVVERAKDYSDLIWYRIKDGSAAYIYQQTLLLKRNFPKVKLILSSHADIASVTNCFGVHLNSNDIPVTVIKKAFPKLIVGYSAHNQNECTNGADYYTLSPIFNTVKPYAVSPIGIQTALYDNIFALGGINKGNIDQLAGKRFKGVAGISLYNDIKEIYTAVKNIK